MKYKDYYGILGVARDASDEDIKKAYRKLARKHHPDMAKEAGSEERFKEIGEAYATLKDPEKRAAYDALGKRAPGEEIRPPPEWASDFEDIGAGFEDVSLEELLASLTGRGRRRPPSQMRGEDFEVTVELTLEQAFSGTELNLELSMPEYDQKGVLRRVARTVRARIPKGATDGQRLRVPGKGGNGYNGGPPGDLYLNIVLHPHRLFRVVGHDLYLDLPLAPWEAVLGATVQVPTLAGPVELRVPRNTRAGQRLRLSGRGLPKPGGSAGDLYAVVQIAVPAEPNERDRKLFEELAANSAFNPREHLA